MKEAWAPITLNPIKVKCLNNGKTYKSMTEAASQLKVSSSYVYTQLKRRPNNFKFKFQKIY